MRSDCARSGMLPMHYTHTCTHAPCHTTFSISPPVCHIHFQAGFTDMKEAAVPGIAGRKKKQKNLLEVRLRKHEKTADVPLLPSSPLSRAVIHPVLPSHHISLNATGPAVLPKKTSRRIASPLDTTPRSALHACSHVDSSFSPARRLSVLQIKTHACVEGVPVEARMLCPVKALRAGAVKRRPIAVVKLYGFLFCFCLQASDIAEVELSPRSATSQRSPSELFKKTKI